ADTESGVAGRRLHSFYGKAQRAFELRSNGRGDTRERADSGCRHQPRESYRGYPDSIRQRAASSLGYCDARSRYGTAWRFRNQLLAEQRCFPGELKKCATRVDIHDQSNAEHAKLEIERFGS